MLYLCLAHAVIGLHLLLVAVLFIGGAALMTGTLFSWPLAFQIGFAGCWVAVLLSQGCCRECLLTRWEKGLWERHQAGFAYTGSFLAHYFPFLSRFINRYGIVIILAGMVVGLCLRL